MEDEGPTEKAGEPGAERLTIWQRMVLREVRRRAGREGAEPLSEDDWRTIFELHVSRRGRAMERFWKLLPGSPRCSMCGAPFSRPGSLAARPLGYRPSRKNPTVCATCVESSPPGGTTMTTGVMFADLRGFTARSEGLAPREASELLNRFYGAAERTLFPEAIIDKLIGDEVMALYLSPLEAELAPRTIPDLMLDHSRRLLAEVGYGSGDGPFIDLGIGLAYGDAYVGNVGDRAVYDFTAVGDVVNTAARLQNEARPGEVVLTEAVAAALSDPAGEPVELDLKGKSEPERAYRVGVGARSPSE